MIKVLLVDDNNLRVADIKSAFSSFKGITDYSFQSCHSVIGAQQYLLHEYYDLLIVDLNLPFRDSDQPKHDSGLRLLRKILVGDRFIVPPHIVAITSYPELKEVYMNEFAEHSVTVIQYSTITTKWQLQLEQKLKHITLCKINVPRDSSVTHHVFTVHGIRTFGEWQKRLKDLLIAFSPDVRVFSFNYGYFSILLYFIPMLRNKVSDSFLRNLERHLEQNPLCQVDIVAHSFGTYIVANAIKGLSGHFSNRIRRVIFAGSVLPADFEWGPLFENHMIKDVVNECGVSDLALLFNGLLIPYAGVAGLTGFSGITSTSFVNRFHSGSHCSWFVRKNVPYDDFMEHYWVPILLSDASPQEVDLRKSPSILTGIFQTIIHNCHSIKLSIYLFIFLVFLRCFFH